MMAIVKVTRSVFGCSAALSKARTVLERSFAAGVSQRRCARGGTSSAGRAEEAVEEGSPAECEDALGVLHRFTQICADSVPPEDKEVLFEPTGSKWSRTAW